MNRRKTKIGKKKAKEIILISISRGFKTFKSIKISLRGLYGISTIRKFLKEMIDDGILLQEHNGICRIFNICKKPEISNETPVKNSIKKPGKKDIIEYISKVYGKAFEDMVAAATIQRSINYHIECIKKLKEELSSFTI